LVPVPFNTLNVAWATQKISFAWSHFLRDVKQWEPVARVHGRYFGDTRPANTLVEAKLVGDYDVEIEAEAVVG